MNKETFQDELNKIKLPDVIGITGKAGAGKDTVARLINDRFPEYHRTLFADKIKETACFLFGWNRADLEDFDFKESFDPKWGFTPRRVLQLLGTEFGRALDENLWLNIVKNTSQRPLIVTDVRFQNEADWIREAGVLIHVEADVKTTQSAAHVSESGIYKMPDDLVIHNYHRGLEELEVDTLRTLARKFGGFNDN